MASPVVPCCPRCGYDLSGVIGSWANSCPLEGVCSECGLAFRWHDVISADRLLLRGFFEHAGGFRQRLGWAWRTWWWALWPRRFWERIGMKFSPRIRWIVLWPLFLFLPLHLLASLLEIASQAVGVMKHGPLGEYFGEYWRWAFAPLAGISGDSPISADVRSVFAYLRPGYAVPGLALSAMFPLLLLVLFQTRHSAKVRAGHVIRAGVFGLAWFGLPALVALVWRIWFFGVERLIAVRSGSSSSFIQAAGPMLYLLYRHSAWLSVPIVAWVLVWWYRAISTLLVGHNPGRIFLILAIPATLAAVIALLTVEGFVRLLI